MPGIAPADFKGAVTLVNVWASWCVPCHDEAPLLMQLGADKRIRIVGINYKDQPDNARRFLGRYGNPFAAAGADGNGRASIEWGVYGVPETFIVGRDGTHRLQAGRPDHRGQSRARDQARDREGAGEELIPLMPAQAGIQFFACCFPGPRFRGSGRGNSRRELLRENKAVRGTVQ